MMSQKTDYILNELNKIFPNAKCELIHSNAFELLIAVSLSAQTTDERVNAVVPNLFAKYHNPLELSNAKQEDVEVIIQSIGLYRNKASNIIKLAKILVSDYNGIVPNTMEELIKLPGVGRKTANVVLSEWFDVPAIAVDTHVARISKRLGLAKKDDDVLMIEQKLMKKLKKRDWNHAHHLFIFFGRYLCKAKLPECYRCPLKEICKK